MELMKWFSEGEPQWESWDSAAYSTPSVVSVITQCDTNSMADLASDNSEPSPNDFIQHCFKRYKLQEKHPHAILKLKSNRFGPAPTRRRILIAPPMQGISLPRAKPRVVKPLDLKRETIVDKEQVEEVAEISKEEEEVRELGIWIEETKELRNVLNKCADVEKWLIGKDSVSEQEANVLRKIRRARKVKKTQVKAPLITTSSIEQVLPVRKPRKIIPAIHTPYPESLITLQNLLHKQKLKLVDIFTKEDRTKSMRFRRADFIRIIEGTKVPISKIDLEDVVVYLTSTRRGNYITHGDLMDCQKIWLDYLKDQWKHAKEAKPEELPPTDQKVGPMIPKWVLSGHSKSKLVPSQKSKSNFLEVPPINTEKDRMHLSYTKQEEVGKRYREVRRQLKRKITPLEWAENCRVVKSGDPVVDSHCRPSTVKGDMGELVDQHRMACHLAWFHCVKLCERYGIPLTERLLQRALLYAGDKLLDFEGTKQKIRQPGGYYEVSDRQGSVSETMSELEEQVSTKKKDSEPEPKPEKRERKPIWGRWKSYAEFRNLMKRHSKRLRLAAQNLWDVESSDSSASSSQMQFENDFIEREMRKMFGYLNPKTDANSFWPGHLLDKLRLHLPEIERDEGNALFSRVSRTRPAYCGLHRPHRHWPDSELKFVTYGDPNSRRFQYYI
ncbi:EF-hand calcium-binding domain-containing protein 12 isoform X2 [Paroedura picta]|uniref:EF-hand calcium-binding domain-containing protein 12 isoform X2 n=1 Tax=Paroedura picta TaxID=143630 RepID=UPI00405737D5